MLFQDEATADYRRFARLRNDHYFNIRDHDRGYIFWNHAGRPWTYFHNPTDPFSNPLENSLALAEHALGIDWPGLHRYGWNWPRHVTYIDISANIGLHALIRLLPTLPPWTCIVLRAFWRPWGRSAYAMDWGSWNDYGYNEALFQPDSQFGHFHDGHQLIRAFISIAHALGHKVAFLLISNSGQVQIDGHGVDWNDVAQQNTFVGKCQHAASLGFDGMFVDSAAHSGGFHRDQIARREHYGGNGQPIPALVIHRLIKEIRWVRPEFKAIGECAVGESRFEDLGYNAGIGHDALMRDHDSIYRLADEQAWRENYGDGVFVSTNDHQWRSYAERLQAAATALLTYHPVRHPVWLTQQELFPANVSYHQILNENIDWRFHLMWDDAAKSFRWSMNEIFAHAN